MAYAAVVLLMRNLDEILDPASYLMHLNEDEIKSLRQEVKYLKSFLEDPQERGFDHEVVKNLEIKIRDAALKAADFIDSNVCITNTRPAHLPERDFGWKQISAIAQQSFSQIFKEIKSVKLEVLQLFEIKSERKFKPGVEEIPLSQDLTPSAEEKLVGIDDDIEKLLDQLIGEPLHRQVIPIVGMAGIGKTTLAQRIYNDRYVIYHFHIRAWITMPQRTMPQRTMPLAYRVREMFLGLLKCFTNITDDICKMTNEELGEKLYKSLKGMRYLVVLDDMWQTTDWNILKIFFPDDRNGSRITFTSRFDDIAVSINRASSPHCMHFLEVAESWELLESKLFPKERCLPELVEIGKRIAVKCKGLPLAIVVVAGVLNTMNKTLDSWLEIAETVESVVIKHMDILALSYHYLPHHLKACFLYMGAFPRDYDIPVSRLIWLWIAEGLVVPVMGRCLEVVADGYLEDLVNRNLILVGERRSSGKIKTCHIHDMLRDLCLQEAQEENFLHVIKGYAPTFLIKAIAPRRICLHANILHDFPMHPMPLARTFLCYDKNKSLPDVFLLEFMEQIDFKLLRVFDIELLQSNHFPIEITELIHLRYLAMAINCELPRSIFKLQKLQTLIIDHIWEGQCLPQEIWKMPQLRHICIKRGCYFPPPYKEKHQFVLKNLQTLSALIGPISCSKEVFLQLPSLRKLEILATESDFQIDWSSEYLEILATESDSQFDWSSECLSNLVWLNQLETLKCSFLFRPRMHRLPRSDNFPENLKKLTLSGSYLPWKDMATLAVLPNLEVLKLRSFAFDGYVWTPVEEGFLQLKLLLLENTDPVSWEADDSHFPRLQQLVLRNCRQLKEIPEGIGGILTLQMIELHDCSYSVVSSARKIHEQHQMLGNDHLVIRIT